MMKNQKNVNNCENQKWTSYIGWYILAGVALLLIILLLVEGFKEKTGTEDVMQPLPSDISSGSTETAVTRDEALEENALVYENLKVMEREYLNTWQEKLQKEQAITEGVQVNFFRVDMKENGRRLYGISEDWWKEEVNKPIDYELEFYYHVLDENSIPTSFMTKATCRIKEDGLHVAEEEMIFLEQVNSAVNADYVEASADFFREGTLLTDIDEYVQMDENLYHLLQTPDRAAERLLHLSGGTGECIPWISDRICVIYTFSDGGHINVMMSREKVGWWFPDGIIMDDESIKAYRLCREYLETVTLEKLEESERNNARVLNAGGNEWLELKNEYVPLSSTEDHNNVLYGLYGGEGMVLRRGEDVYPIHQYWVSPQMHIPVIYEGDYDQDGILEIALFTHMGTGTGISISQLYMMETGDGELQMNEFTWEEAVSQLGENLEENESFHEYQWGDFLDFIEEDGKWYMEAEGGKLMKDCYILDYSDGMKARAQVHYKDGEFVLSEITLEKQSQGN